MIEVDFGFQMPSYHCSVEWLTTYSNLVKYDRQLHNDDKDAVSFVQVEADSGFQMLSCHCSVEWLTTYSNLVEYDLQLHNDDKDAVSFVQAFESQPSLPQGFQLPSYLT